MAVNDYEWQLLQQKTGLTRDAMSTGRVEALIVTRGAEGSVIYTPQGRPRHPLRQARRPWSTRRVAAMPTALG